MSRKYTKSNFADLLENLIPELYRNEDIQMSGLTVDPVLDLINRHVAAVDDGVLSISSIPDDDTTFRLDNVSGMSQYFVKQNELTNISPYTLESKVLLPLSASLADFSTSSDFNEYLSATLLPKIVPPTTTQAGTLLENIETLSALVDSTETSAVHAHLVDTLGLMYFLNTSADGGLDYTPSAFVLDSLTKVFNGTTLQTIDGVKGLNAYLWNNLEVCSFTPYIPEDFETLEQLQTLTEVVYSPSYFDKDDTKVKDAFDDFMNAGVEQTDTVSAGPMRKLLTAMGYSFADISDEIENIGLIYDIENVSEEQLQYIAQLIGFRLRGNSSDKWRHQLRIAVDLYKKSGTLAAIQGAINALISETVFDVSGKAQELWECYLPQLIWYALGTESPMFRDLTTWTAEAARLAEVDAYSASSLEDNLKATTDAIILDLYKAFPDNFLFFGQKLPVPRLVELDSEGCAGDVYTIINEPAMRPFFVIKEEDDGYQIRQKEANRLGEPWISSQGPLGEGIYIAGEAFPTEGRPTYLTFEGDLEFVFSYRTRTNFPLPPFEEVKYYRDSSVTADMVAKLIDRLKCFQVRPEFADWLGQFILDAAVTDSSNLGTLNEWLMFFDEPQKADNFDNVMMSTSNYQRNLLDLFSGKSSHLFIDFDGADFDFAKTTLEGDGKYALYEAARISREFSPAHAITRVNLNATAADVYEDIPTEDVWSHIKIDYDDVAWIGYSSGTVMANFENRGVPLEFFVGGGDDNLGSNQGRGGLNTFKREFVNSIYDEAMASELILEPPPEALQSNTPVNYIVANDLDNNTVEQSRDIIENKRATRSPRGLYQGVANFTRPLTPEVNEGDPRWIDSAWRLGPRSNHPDYANPTGIQVQADIGNPGSNGYGWETGEPWFQEWQNVGLTSIPNGTFGGLGEDLILENLEMIASPIGSGSQWLSNMYAVYLDDPVTGDSDPNYHYLRPGKYIWNNVHARGDINGVTNTAIKWGAREFSLRDRELYDCDFSNIEKEHGIYTALNGDFLFEGCTVSSMGSQGVQVSYRDSPFQSYNSGDNNPYDGDHEWKIKDSHFYNCGDSARNGSRPAFTMTFFTPGNSHYPGTVVVEDSSVLERFSVPINDNSGDRNGGLSRKTMVCTKAQGTSFDTFQVPTITVSTQSALPGSGSFRQLARVTDVNKTFFWNGSSWEDWGDVTGNLMKEVRMSNCLIHTVKQGSTGAMSIRGADLVKFEHTCFIYDRFDPNWSIRDYKISIDSENMNSAGQGELSCDDGVNQMKTKKLEIKNCKGVGRNGGRVIIRIFETTGRGTSNKDHDWVYEIEIDETSNVNKVWTLDLEDLSTATTLLQRRSENFANPNLLQIRDFDVVVDGDYPSAELGSGGGGTPPSNEVAPGQVQNTIPVNAATDVSLDVNCSWQTVPQATSYDVYFDLASNGLGSTVPVNQTASTFDPGTLLESTEYIWRVDSVNQYGTTQGVATTFTTQGPPSPPVGAVTNTSPANLSTGVDRNVNLSWDADPEATGYKVFFGIVGTPPLVSEQQELFYDPGLLDYDTLYFWRVATLGLGGPVTTALQRFTTESEPPPPPVVPDSVTQGTPNGLVDVRIDTALGWTAANNAETYDVYLDTVSPPVTKVADDTQNTSFQPASPLTPGVTYYWRVDATNTFGTTAGTEFSFTTLPLPGEVTNGGPNQTTGVSRNTLLTWVPADDAEEYDVYFGAGTTNLIGTVSTTYLNPGILQYRTLYSWSVNAKNSSGETVGTTTFTFSTEVEDTGGEGEEGSDQVNRRALRRRNYKYLLPKEGYYDRTGHNAPVSWEVSSMENFGDGLSEVALGYVASAGKFHPVVDPINPSGVWDACEGLNSPRSFSGVDTADTFPYRGLDDMTPSAYHVDRDQLPGIYRTMHELLELKARDYADQIISDDPDAYSGDAYWKNNTQSLANSAIEDGYVLNSRDEYDNFKFGVGLHKLFSDYNAYFATHPLAPHIWNQTGGNVFAHVFGKGLLNCDFSVKGNNWLRADGQSFFASSVDSGVSVNTETLWNESAYDVTTENNLVRAGRFVGYAGWDNFEGIEMDDSDLGPDFSTAATTMIIQVEDDDSIGPNNDNQRTETTFPVESGEVLDQPFTFNIYFKKTLNPAGEAYSQLRYHVSLGSTENTFEEDLDIRFNAYTGAVDSYTEVTDGPGYDISDAVPTANDWWRATVMLKDFAGTAAFGRFILSPAPFSDSIGLEEPLSIKVWNAECQKGEGFTEVFYGAGTQIATRPLNCVVPLSGTFVEGEPFNAEFRNSTILSGIELTDISGAPAENEFKIFRLDPSKRVVGESNYLVENTFVKCKAQGGLPRMRFDLAKYGDRRNYFIPEHKFRLDVSALVADERSKVLGGGQLGVWIHTAPVNGYFWSFTGDGKWTPMKTEEISINNVISWSHIHTFANRVPEGTAAACLNTLVQAASGTVDVNFNTIEEDFFETVSIEFDTRNYTDQNNSEYLDVIPRTDDFHQVTPIVHDSRNNYVVEVFFVPNSNEDKFMVIDNIGLTDLTLRDGASIGTDHGVETAGVPLRRFVKEDRLYLDKGQLADVLKFYNGMVGSSAGEYTTPLASRDARISSEAHEVSGGSRLNYRISPAWNNYTKQSGHQNYEEVEFEN